MCPCSRALSKNAHNAFIYKKNQSKDPERNFLLCRRGSPNLRSNDIKNTQQKKNFYGAVENLKIEVDRVLDIAEDLNHLYL